MTRWFATTWALWRTGRRDPMGFVFILLLPVGMAVILGSIYTAEDSSHRIALIAEGDGPVTAMLVDRISSNDRLELVDAGDRKAAERALRRRTIDAIVVVPAAVDTASEQVDVRLVGPPGIAAPSGLRSEVQLAVSATTARLVIARAAPTGDPTADLAAADAAVKASGLDDQSTLDDIGGDGRALTALFASVVLFTFINTLASASHFRYWRDRGVLTRIRSTAAGGSAALVGFGSYLTAFAICHGLIVTFVGGAVMGVRWEHPLVVVVVLSVVGVSAGALGSLVATLLPAYPHGATVAAPVGFVMGMLGGCLWPLSIVSPALRAVGHATPHAWAIDALGKVADGHSFSAIAQPLAVLLSISLVLGGIAVVRMRGILKGAS